MKAVLFPLATIVCCMSIVSCGSSGGGSGTTAPPVVAEPVPDPPVVDVPVVDPPIDNETDEYLCGYFETPLVIASAGTTRIEAENYDTCDTSSSDASTGNSGAEYREDDVDINTDALNSNDHYVVDAQKDEYLEFTVDVEKSGMFALAYQVKTDSGQTANIALSVAGESVAASDVAFSATTDEMWMTTEVTRVYLSDGPQVIRLAVTEGVINLDYLEVEYDEPLMVSPEQAVASMQVGINLGNTLDAPYEGDWAPEAQLEYFVAFKEAGFNHVRIPATWHNHTSAEAPYTVDAERMDRTEKVVDWALAQGDIVIINMHHESWLKNDYDNTGYQQRFEAIWRQIAARFQNKSPRLLFEILNEPHGMTVVQADDANARILPIIRETNPTRNVIFSGNDFTPLASLLGAAVPTDDYLIGNFHSYDPWVFAGQCQTTWGTAQDQADLEDIYEQAQAWSVANDIPVTVNEVGAAHYDFTLPENICSEEQRLAYLQAHVTNATERGISITVWDDNGSFGIYDRLAATWGAEKDILVSEND